MSLKSNKWRTLLVPCECKKHRGGAVIWPDVPRWYLSRANRLNMVCASEALHYGHSPCHASSTGRLLQGHFTIIVSIAGGTSAALFTWQITNRKHFTKRHQSVWAGVTSSAVSGRTSLWFPVLLPFPLLFVAHSIFVIQREFCQDAAHCSLSLSAQFSYQSPAVPWLHIWHCLVFSSFPVTGSVFLCTLLPLFFPLCCWLLPVLVGFACFLFPFLWR